MIQVPNLEESELADLPVFPLPRVVLFPRSILPLHLFEPRYRDMMEHCLKEGPMAMVISLLDPTWDGEPDAEPSFHEIACAGCILDHRRHPDGRFDILLGGLSRVRLRELPSRGETFRRVHADILEDRISHPAAVQAQIRPLLAVASSASSLIRQRIPDFDLGVSADLPPGTLADTIADRLVASPAKRQRILETADVKVRLALVLDEVLELSTRLRSETGEVLH